MAMQDEKPEVRGEEPEAPTGEVTLESGARGADLASTARSPELSTPATGDGEETAPTAEQAAPATAGSAARKYRPTEDYAEGDRIYHSIWNAEGVVTYRDPREQIFRLPVGRIEDRGRCRMIRVQFEKEVPASGGPRREVMLIADWHGRAFEVGAPPAPVLPEPEPLLELREPVPARAAPARAKAPALPEIPEPDLEEDLDTEEPEDEEPTEEGTEPIGI